MPGGTRSIIIARSRRSERGLMRRLERRGLFELIALEKIGQHAMPDCDHLAAILHAVLLLDKPATCGIEAGIRDEFDLDDRRPLLVLIGKQTFRGPGFGGYLFYAVQYQFSPMTTGLAPDVAPHRPPKAVVQKRVRKNSVAARGFGSGRPVVRLDLLAIAYRAHNALHDGRVDATADGVGHRRDGYRLCAAHSQPS